MCICVFQARPNPIHKFLAMYVTKPRLFFDHALRNRFAVPSFNVCNLEIARGVITAAEAEDAPVILQTYFGDLYHGGVNSFSRLLLLFLAEADGFRTVHAELRPSDDNDLPTVPTPS